MNVTTTLNNSFSLSVSLSARTKTSSAPWYFQNQQITFIYYKKKKNRNKTLDFALNTRRKAFARTTCIDRIQVITEEIVAGGICWKGDVCEQCAIHLSRARARAYDEFAGSDGRRARPTWEYKIWLLLHSASLRCIVIVGRSISLLFCWWAAAVSGCCIHYYCGRWCRLLLFNCIRFRAHSHRMANWAKKKINMQ